MSNGSAILTWNAAAVEAAFADAAERGLTAAMDELKAYARRLVAIAGDGEPSAAGDPPHRQSGRLQANIDYTVERDDDSIRGFLGVRKEVPYALRLELGFVGIDSLGRHYDQAARPFLRPTVLRDAARILELVGAGSK